MWFSFSFATNLSITKSNFFVSFSPIRAPSGKYLLQKVYPRFSSAADIKKEIPIFSTAIKTPTQRQTLSRGLLMPPLDAHKSFNKEIRELGGSEMKPQQKENKTEDPSVVLVLEISQKSRYFKIYKYDMMIIVFLSYPVFAM